MRNYEAFVVHIMCIEDKALSSAKKRKKSCNEDDNLNGNLSEINYSCRVTRIWQFFCPEQFIFYFGVCLQAEEQPI